MPAKHHARAIVITIDGPAGTGKSTVAHKLSKRLGLDFLDTGAMYRAAALVALERGLDPADGVALAKAVAQAGMHFDWTGDPPRLMLDHRDVSARIRDLDVSAIVSIVAAQPQVRQVLVEQQRKISQQHPRLVTEGRDQGSVVFPDAPVRFFLEADMQVRAERRAKQLRAAGKKVARQRVLEDIARRDRLDAGRADAPLTCPEGAIVISTGERSADEVVEEMERHVRRELPTAGFRS
jgi:cytidylate kinase